ncbi:hypothetical protein Q8A73_005933 [Channa argus]|nr:hypothetical protein Q8A73_005933 [Channa argus]
MKPLYIVTSPMKNEASPSLESRDRVVSKDFYGSVELEEQAPPPRTKPSGIFQSLILLTATALDTNGRLNFPTLIQSQSFGIYSSF